MRRNTVAAALAVAAVAILGALAASVFVLGDGGDSGASDAVEEPIAASASISPRIALFGDTVTAHVDVTIDRTELDPEFVRVTAGFKPWKQVGEPTLVREDVDAKTYLRATFVLRCLISLCVPPNESMRVDLKPARVTYEAPVGKGVERLVVDAHWPPFFVHSRLDEASFSERDPLAAPWRAELVSLPAVTYRIRPGLLIALLLMGGIALVVVAVVLAYRALPRRREPAPEPPPAPKPVLSPLEQALLLLETPAADDGVADRRRALELVADELAEWGERRLEGTARALAWSEEDPAAEATRALAATVRARVEEGFDGRPE